MCAPSLHHQLVCSIRRTKMCTNIFPPEYPFLHDKSYPPASHDNFNFCTSVPTSTTEAWILDWMRSQTTRLSLLWRSNILDALTIPVESDHFVAFQDSRNVKTNTETCCAEPVFVNMSDITSQGTPSMDINTFLDSLLQTRLWQLTLMTRRWNSRRLACVYNMSVGEVHIPPTKSIAARLWTKAIVECCTSGSVMLVPGRRLPRIISVAPLTGTTDTCVTLISSLTTSKSCCTPVLSPAPLPSASSV